MSDLPAIPEDYGFRPGQIYINKRGEYLKILRLEDNGYVVYQYSEHVDGGVPSWDRESRTKAKEFDYYHKHIYVGDKLEHVSALEEAAIDAARHPPEGPGEDVSTTALAPAASKDRLLAMESAARSAMERSQALQRIMERKANALQNIAHKYQKQLQEIVKVIGVIEMYLGVGEEIVQIRDGEPAGTEEPIVIRQAVLYMDEEVGDPRHNPKTGQYGIDFQSVEDFDAWAIQPDNLHLLLPHEKGVVALCPSRQERTYAQNPLTSAWINANNKMSYLLIRNGDRIYRVWTNTGLGRRLLPSAGEIDKAWQGQGYFERERAKDKEFSYRKKALLIQGLIDRTPIFLPMIHRVNLFDPETYSDGLVQLVFDDEPPLMSGDRLMYHEWKDKINSQIGRGSRVLIAPTKQYTELGWSEYCVDRFVRYYRHPGNCPKLPWAGVYKVDRIRERKSSWSKNIIEDIIILYQPGGEVYTNWYYDVKPRTNRVSFILHRRDSFLLNYDAISLEDAEWYINCRYERQNYLEMIPVLWEIWDRRLEELAWEKHFVELVASRQGCRKEEVWEAVEWWKTKNIWKRPIAEDDAKALRMIEKRIGGRKT